MVRIITDTTACLPAEVAKQYSIPVVPQIIHFCEETFFEGIDMDIDAFIIRLKTDHILPKTAAPPPELFIAQFEKIVPSGETILCIHLSRIFVKSSPGLAAQASGIHHFSQQVSRPVFILPHISEQYFHH